MTIDARDADRLDSWKDIAAHFKRTVRTVQRWQALGLPVHRHEHHAGSSVYAYRSEIERWWALRRPDAELTSPGEAAGPPAATVPRIAVLPFVNHGDPADERYFADGFVDELITRLAAFRAVRVISRTSVMRFRHRANPSLRRVAALLSVAFLIEGAIGREQESVVVTVRVVDPSDGGRIVRSQRYTSLYRDIHHLQATIAHDIVTCTASGGHLQPDVLSPTTRRVVPEAQDAYLKGRYYLHQRTTAALTMALERFAQSAAFDAGDARGYAGLAETYVLLSGNEFWAPADGFPKARDAAAKALARDPQNAVAHACMGMVLALFDWQWEEADAAFGRAVELNPHYADAFHWQGITRLMSGLIDESIGPLEQAVTLDPLSPIIAVNSGRPFHFMGRYDEAIARCDRAIALVPDFWIAHYNRAMALSAQGDAPAALAAAQRALETSQQGAPALMALAEAQVVAGRLAEASSTLGQIVKAARTGGKYVNAFRVGRAFAVCGMSGKALEWLSRSRRERSLGNSTYLPVDSVFDPLRSSPRFQDLLSALRVRRRAR